MTKSIFTKVEGQDQPEKERIEEHTCVIKPSIQIRNSIANHKTSVGITGEILNIAMLGPVLGRSGGRGRNGVKLGGIPYSGSQHTVQGVEHRRVKSVCPFPNGTEGYDCGGKRINEVEDGGNDTYR